MKLSLPFFFYYISATVQSFAFAPNHYHYHSTSSNSNSNRGAIIILHSQNPFAGYNPGSAAPDPTPTSSQQQKQQQESPNEDQDGDDDEASLKGNRWSKFAPDASLSSEDFRSQLKENMKADLERRRREDPNRGNQPAKSYLDNL